MIKKSILVFTLVLMFCGTVWAEGPIILKWATFEPPNGWSNQGVFEPWINEVNKVDKDVLQFKMFSGGTLGRNPTVYLKLILDGVADVGFIMNPYQPGRFVDDLVCSFPMIADNTLKPSVAMHRLYERGMLRGYEDLHPISILATNQNTLHTNFPVNSLDDLKGKKIRAAGKIQFKLIEALGAIPVNVSITEAAENISRNVIQGAFADVMAIKTYRIQDVARYHTLVPLGCVAIMNSMSKERYESLPVRAREIIDKHAGMSIVRKWGQLNDSLSMDVIAEWQKDPKHTVTILNPEQAKKWQQAMAPALEDWKKEDPRNPGLFNAYMEELAKVQ